MWFGVCNDLVYPMVRKIQCLWHMIQWVGCDTETNEEHDKDCVKEGF